MHTLRGCHTRSIFAPGENGAESFRNRLMKNALQLLYQKHSKNKQKLLLKRYNNSTELSFRSIMQWQ